MINKTGLFLLALLLSVATGWAGTSDEARRFADYLFEKNDVNGAAVEYERTLFLDPQSAERDSIRIRLSECYRQKGEPDKSVKILEDLRENPTVPESKFQAYYLLGKIYYGQKRYPLADAELTEALSQSPAPESKAKIIYLKSLSLARERKWDAAARSLDALGNAEKTKAWRDHLSAGLKSGKNLPEWRGFWLVPPGSGHFYAGQWADGTVSLLLNGFFGIWAVNSFQHHHDAQGVVVGVLELGWYTGNIYSASGAVYRYNRYQETQFFDRLRELNYPEDVRKQRKIQINLFSARF